MPKLTLVEQLTPVSLLAAAADAGGRTSVYISLATCQRATIVCHIYGGNAATILLTPLQASDIEGTGSKVLATNQPIWANLATLVSSVFGRAADGVNYTTDAGTTDKIIVFQIDPEYLDQAHGFDCIGISTGASNAANITEATLFLDQRYAQPVPPEVEDL